MRSISSFLEKQRGKERGQRQCRLLLMKLQKERPAPEVVYQTCSSILKVDPRNSEALARRAWAQCLLHKAGKVDGAAAALADALKALNFVDQAKEPILHSTIRMLIGFVYFTSGHFEEASKAYKSALVYGGDPKVCTFMIERASAIQAAGQLVDLSKKPENSDKSQVEPVHRDDSCDSIDSDSTCRGVEDEGPYAEMKNGEKNPKKILKRTLSDSSGGDTTSARNPRPRVSITDA